MRKLLRVMTAPALSAVGQAVLIAGMAAVSMVPSRAAESPSFSIGLRTLLGWEIHRDQDYSRFHTGASRGELFGPSENERLVSDLGMLAGPEITLQRGPFLLRSSALFGQHGLVEGKSGTRYLSGDLLFGRTLGPVVGVRHVRVTYDDLDSTRFAGYTLADLVAGLHLDLRELRGHWGFSLGFCLGLSALPKVFNETSYRESSELGEVDLRVTYSPARGHVLLSFGYSLLAHRKYVRTYTPASTLIFDRVWEEYYPLWHGISLNITFTI